MLQTTATTFLRSMTGFGVGIASLGNRALRVEIRTLNHRGLDLKVQARECQIGAEVESEINRLVRKGFTRGAVQVTIREEGRSRRSSGLDLDGLKQLHTDLVKVQASLGLGGEVSMQALAQFYSSVPTSTPSELTISDWEALKEAIEQALSGVQAMRKIEGGRLADDLRARLTTLQDLADRIRGASAGVPSKAARRLQERLATLGNELPPMEPGRLAQEIVILVERFDVSEEIVRLQSHFAQLDTLIRDDLVDPPGRRIDFLAQEMGRELNTIGAKIQDSETIALVIAAKAELEKLREQAQNIE